MFFGRGQETKELAELLRSPAERAKQAVLLVVGPSGCGKSSLIRAGLAHLVAQEAGWRTLPPILPGADPVAALARELAAAAQPLGLDWTVATVREQLEDTKLIELADELLLAAQAQRLLVMVDQFEELLTQSSRDARAQFTALLNSTLGSPVDVVATLRPEFLDQLLGDTELDPIRLYPLRPLHREALREVIEKPAELAGIGVAEGLVAQLITDTDTGEALPLLAFTLAQLAEDVTRDGHLSAARYEQLGGVKGALTRQADAALAEASAASGRGRKQVISGLLRLVTVDGQGRPTRWRAPRAELAEPVAQEVDLFISRRLLTTDRDHGSVVVGVAHEAILTAWQPLAREIEANVSALRARSTVEQAAADWKEDKCRPARLWERGQLAAALADTGAQVHGGDLLTSYVELNPVAREFLRKSIRRDRLRRGRALTVLSVLLVIALVAAGIAFAQRHKAEQQRHEAQRQRNVAVSEHVADQALKLRATNPGLAAQLALAAYRLSQTPEARGSLLSVFATPYSTRLTGHTRSVSSVAFSPDGHTLATASADKTVRLWDTRDPHHPHPLGIITGHHGSVHAVAFSPDGRTLATGSDDTTTRLWDVSDPGQPRPLGTLSLATTVYSVAFSPHGHTLATGSQDGTVRLWDVHDPGKPSPWGSLIAHTDAVRSVAFSPDGHTLATGSYDITTRLWDIRDAGHPSLLQTFTGHTDTVFAVAFSPDGHTLATAGDDRTARLWSIRDPNHPSLLSTLTGHNASVKMVAFSPDGHLVATSSYDHTARLWDIYDDPYHPRLLGTMTGYRDYVWSVTFSPDGRTLITGSVDGTARWWDIHDLRQPLNTILSDAGTVRSVAFSPNGRTLAIASEGTVQLREASDPRRPRLLGNLTGLTGTVYSVAFSPDGATLATASYDNTVQLWDVRNPQNPGLLRTLTGHNKTVFSVVFSPDGRIPATGSADHTARLWENDVHSVAARVCRITPAITQKEWDHYLPGLPYRPPCP